MAAQRTLLVTLTGRDRPGVTSALFSAVEPYGVEVIDVEQVVIRGVSSWACSSQQATTSGRCSARSSTSGPSSTWRSTLSPAPGTPLRATPAGRT